MENMYNLSLLHTPVNISFTDGIRQTTKGSDRATICILTVHAGGDGIKIYSGAAVLSPKAGGVSSREETDMARQLAFKRAAKAWVNEVCMTIGISDRSTAKLIVGRIRQAFFNSREDTAELREKIKNRSLKHEHEAERPQDPFVADDGFPF